MAQERLAELLEQWNKEALEVHCSAHPLNDNATCPTCRTAREPGMGAFLDRLAEPMKPCAFYNYEADFTEVVLRDCATIYQPTGADTEVGYDMKTGDLVVVRLPGDVTKRKKT